MSTQMSVFLSTQAAQPQWGEKALISFAEQGATIHLQQTQDFSAIQRAARKLDNQGIRTAFLAGEGWDLESIWAFYQGYRDAKKRNTVEWKALAAAEQVELEARIKRRIGHAISSTKARKKLHHANWRPWQQSSSNRLRLTMFLTVSSKTKICSLKGGRGFTL